MQWQVLEYGDFGKIVKEEAILYENVVHVINLGDEFEASFESKQEPYYLVKNYKAKKSAKDWCERMLRKYV